MKDFTIIEENGLKSSLAKDSRGYAVCLGFMHDYVTNMALTENEARSLYLAINHSNVFENHNNYSSWIKEARKKNISDLYNFFKLKVNPLR